MIIETESALKLINKYFQNRWVMKTKKEELDVDFIGGQGSLSKEEEIALSDFFKSKRTPIRYLKSVTSKKKKRQLEA